MAHAVSHKAVREKVERRQAERLAEREVQRLDERDEERAKFIGHKAAELQQIAQMDSFVKHLQAAGAPPMSEAAACLRWAEQFLEEKRAALGLAGIEKAVQASGLWVELVSVQQQS